MTRYILVMAVLALAVGGLFRAVSQYHIPLLEMAGTIGLLLMGAVGTLTVHRYQTDQGRKQVEAALLGLGPEFLITDWSQGRGPAAAPEYLVVAPGGLAAVIVDPMPQSTRPSQVPRRLAQARERARAAAEWVQATAAAAGETVPAPLPVVVLTRRRVQPAETAVDGVLTLNPDDLSRRLAELRAPEHLDAPRRVRITRRLRQVADRVQPGRSG